MKFENPKMNISMFDMENIATTASTNLAAAQENALTDVESVDGFSEVSRVITFEF